MTVPDVLAIVPIRDFTGMTRLAPTLDVDRRARLARLLADTVVSAITSAGLSPVVVTASQDVQGWSAKRGLTICDDPGTGLSGAAAAGVAYAADTPWIVIHADLPLVTASAVATIAQLALTSTVLVPSHDGGTNVIAGRGAFPFSYGVGSFHRHLAAAPDAQIVASPALSVDIDIPEHLAAFPDLVK